MYNILYVHGDIFSSFEVGVFVAVVIYYMLNPLDLTSLCVYFFIFDTPSVKNPDFAPVCFLVSTKVEYGRGPI